MWQDKVQLRNYLITPPVKRDRTFRDRLITGSPTFSTFSAALMRPSILTEYHLLFGDGFVASSTSLDRSSAASAACSSGRDLIKASTASASCFSVSLSSG